MFQFNTVALFSMWSRDEIDHDHDTQTASEKDGITIEEVSITRSLTIPEQSMGSIKHKRTGSGSWLMRKKTFEEREEVSRARASALFEMSISQGHPSFNKDATSKNDQDTTTMGLIEKYKSRDAGIQFVDGLETAFILPCFC